MQFILIHKSSARLSVFLCFIFLPAHLMRLWRLPPWRILGSSLMLFHRARSEVQISELVPFLPRTTCLRRLSSIISYAIICRSDLIQKRAQFLYAIIMRLPFCLCKHILNIMLEARDENTTGLPFACLIT
jgi:hypothetical protein